MAEAQARRPLAVGFAAALFALAVAVGWLYRYEAAAERLAGRYVRSVASANLPFKAQTLTLQRAALRQVDILPIYGTSELYCCGQPYNAGAFFQNAPTGFAVFNVGYPVTEDLFWAETFGALGNQLRGRKLVVSDSPWFLSPGGIAATAYAHTYQPEIADVFAFDAPVPLRLRAAVAARMLAFPATLKGQQILTDGLHDLATGGWRGYGAYLLLDPIGRLMAWQDQLLDAQRTVRAIHPPETPLQAMFRAAAPLPWWRRWLPFDGLRFGPPLWELLQQAPASGAPLIRYTPVPNRPRTVDWSAELRAADRAAAASATSNPFGVAGTRWQKCTDIAPVSGPWCQRALALYRSGRTNHDAQVYPVPQSWVRGVEACACWTDLNLEFSVLRAVRAQPLAWLQPLQGFLDDRTPYSARARRVVYDRYLAIAQADGIPATTFQTHDTDPLFMDSFGHLSQRGWVYADRLLDLFWHGQLGAVRAEMARGGSVDALFPAALNCPKPAWCEGVNDAGVVPGELGGLPAGVGLPRSAGG